MQPGRGLRSVAWSAAAVAIPFALYLAHGACFDGWEIDDAGISYAYARNLIEGHGLIAQPGAEPVEGFTNLAWVLLLAPWLTLVDSPGTAARALSYLLVLGAFVALAWGARRWFGDRWWPVATVGLAASALTTGFVAWTLSGLENGLYAALVAGFVVWISHADDSRASGISTGLSWLLLYATRPDAAPLLIVPVIVWAARRFDAAGRWLGRTVALGFLGLTSFRVLYFGDVLANTYYAKAALGARLLGTVDWRPAVGLGFALVGGLSVWVGVRLAGLLARRLSWLDGRSPRQLGVLTLWLALAVSLLTYQTLPPDWMGEGRFATPVLLLGPLAVLGLARRRARLLAACAVTVLVLVASYSYRHTPAFVSSPPAPFSWGQRLTERLASVAETLGRGDQTTVLLPDVGGALWLDRFEVVDLGGLTDRRIARSLHAESRQALHDYVFAERRPDLILVHGSWQRRARLDLDGRLTSDYEPAIEAGPYRLYVRSVLATHVQRSALVEAFGAETRR